MFLSVPTNHWCIPVLEVALVTLVINFQMVLLHMSPKVAVAPHLLTTVRTLQQSVTVSFRKMDHDGAFLGVGM